MHIFKGRCLCGMSQFSVSLNNFDVYACHCTSARNGRGEWPCIWKRRVNRLWKKSR